MSRLLCLCLVLVGQPLFGALPFHENGEWRGYFAVHEAQRYVFLLRNDGEMVLIPRKRDREWVAVANRIKLEYGIEEMTPDGVVCKQTRLGSLESEQEASDDINKLVIRGTTTGDAVYELIIEQSRDIISIGGRVLDPGKLTKHPLRFAVRATLPNVYRRVEVYDRDEQREFERLTRRDYMEVVRLDHSKVHLTNDDGDPMNCEELTGTGVESIEMRLSYYEGRRFYFGAGRGSGLAIAAARSPGPWYEGMELIWSRDPTVDPDAASRLSLWVK